MITTIVPLRAISTLSTQIGNARIELIDDQIPVHKAFGHYFTKVVTIPSTDSLRMEWLLISAMNRFPLLS